MNLHFEVTGTGRPIVLSTGIGHSSLVWLSLVELLESKARLLCWDHRGHGRSDRPEGPNGYSGSLAVLDLMSMIAKAGGSSDNPVVLVGHSLGGYLSLCAAVQRPELIRAMVLISTGPGFRDDVARGKWNQYALTMDIGGEADPEARRLGVQTDGNVIAHLDSIEAPTLVIVGSNDLRFHDAKDYLVKKMPKAKAIVIDGGRHSVHKSHPEQVNHAINEFLEETHSI